MSIIISECLLYGISYVFDMPQIFDPTYLFPFVVPVIQSDSWPISCTSYRWFGFIPRASLSSPQITVPTLFPLFSRIYARDTSAAFPPAGPKFTLPAPDPIPCILPTDHNHWPFMWATTLDPVATVVTADPVFPVAPATVSGCPNPVPIPDMVPCATALSGTL